jgi:hypothetical protein
MLTRSLFALSLLAGTFFASQAAMANVIVSNTTLPSYSDGPLKISMDDHETLVTKSVLGDGVAVGSLGNLLQGTGILKSISGGINQTFGNSCSVTSTGCSGLFNSTHTLTDVFTGFSLRDTLVDNVDHKTTLYFTGGQFSICELPGSGVPNTSATPDLATALANACAGVVLVQFTPQVQDVFGDTFIATIDNTVLTNFGLAQGVAYLDATGGIGMSYFNTNTVVNSFTGVNADIQFAGRAQTTGCPALSNSLTVCGSDDAFNVKVAQVVPEPLTLSLFGAGLAGAATLRFRRRAKKA